MKVWYRPQPMPTPTGILSGVTGSSSAASESIHHGSVAAAMAHLDGELSGESRSWDDVRVVTVQLDPAMPGVVSWDALLGPMSLS